MIQCIFYFVIQFIAFVFVFKTLIDIRDEVKDTKRIAMQTNRHANDAYDSANFACLRLKDLNEETERISIDTSLIVKRFNNLCDIQKKKEQEELEKKNDHVKRVVERVKSVLYSYPPNMWQYVYEERKERNRHKFTIMCSTTEDIITSVRNAFYNSGVEWSERRDNWDREWTIYIYDAE